MGIVSTEIGVSTFAAGGQSWYPPLAEFLIASLIFIVIIVATVGIGKVVAWARSNQVPPLIGHLLSGAHQGLFMVDILVYGCYVVFKAYELIRLLTTWGR
jgi:hypothetical protein